MATHWQLNTSAWVLSKDFCFLVATAKSHDLYRTESARKGNVFMNMEHGIRLSIFSLAFLDSIR